MSRKSDLVAALQHVVARMGGSHLTREARERTVERFAELMFAAGFTHLAGPMDIGGRQLRLYVEARRMHSTSVRTLQNELAHLRGVLRVAGRRSVVQADELSNQMLGIAGGSRLGSKTAMSQADLDAVCALAIAQHRPGMAALLRLERCLGLRGAEAIHARGDTLLRWSNELRRDGRLNVIAGTKGGRPRIVSVKSIQPAVDAVQAALQVAEQQGGFLVVRANGTPAGGLKQARSIYHSWAQRVGIVPHAARYAFAQEQLAAYLAEGFSPREALIAVSHDLGHGDGRGRWVKSVYMR